MAGDLEDFLKRAAARRLEKTEQAKQAQPAPKVAPSRTREYTDRSRERVARPVEDEPIVADVIEEIIDPLAERRQQLEKAKQRAKEAEQRLKQRSNQKSGRQPKSEGDPSSQPADELIRALRTPAGIRQAILLREILERPDFSRWD